MAETLLSYGVEKLWVLLVRETDRFKGVDEQLITELKSDLNLLRSFLKDADARKHSSETVRNFVEEIKEIVLDTEDIIETFLLKEELNKTSGIKFKEGMRRLSCNLIDRRKIASDMGGISKRISKVMRDMQIFGVQQMIISVGEYSHPLQEIQREMRKTFSSDKERDFVGLEQNVKKLISYLVEEDNIQVISVTGMGGIGKTTLARQVFNHEMVKNHFDGVAWVCISQQFTRTYVWQTILQQLRSKQDEQINSNMTEDELQDKLFRLLETSNALIILDDMWKEEDWDRIKQVFPSKKGWKVILTSRNERVALHADPTCVTIKLECLTIGESWILFQRIAFPRKRIAEHKIDEEMEEMGKKMIKHCGGLPLAIKVLGGLLATQHTLSEWKRVYENIGSYIVGGNSFNDRNINYVYHILSLSFEELPIYLKQCFLYLAHFPEDYPIRVWDLSNYWAAEKIPKPRYYDGLTIREVADGYIEELVKRNMVISNNDFRTTRFETCHVHDMMREVCLLKAGEENFVDIVDAANSQSSYKSRRIAVNRLNETYHWEGEMMNPKLRSLLFMNLAPNWIKSSSLFFTRLQLLRVLNLSCAQFEGGKLPSSIGKLIHLRYLSLFHAKVSHLPSSMSNLKLLLYLDICVDARSPIYIPNFLKEMRELTYLHLPSKIDDKTKFELGNLVNLETLVNFSTKHSTLKDLQKMTRLWNLWISLNGGCTMETLSSSLSELRHLEKLTIPFGYCCMENDKEGFVLDCKNLKQLRLGIYMPKLPDEHHFPSHLTTISLYQCLLEEDPMTILENLVQLKVVDLGYKSFCGKIMICSRGGFPQLQELKIWGLDDLEEWIVEEGSMPLLETLNISLREKFKELPDGLQFIYSLKNLTVGMQWEKRLSEGGEDYYKVQHIPFVNYFGKV